MNAPTRLAAILTKLTRIPVDDTKTLHVWAHALALDYDPEGIDETETMLAVCAVRSEVDSALAALRAGKLPSDLYEAPFMALRGATNVGTLGSPWKDFAGNVNTPHVAQGIGWAGHFLPAEEEVEAEALNELAGEFDKLSEALKTVELPPALRDFAEQQIRRLRAALRMYRVRGAAVVLEAYEATAGAFIVTTKARAAEEATPNEEGRLFMHRFGVALGKVADIAEKANKGTGAVGGLIDKGRGVVEFLVSMTQ